MSRERERERERESEGGRERGRERETAGEKEEEDVEKADMETEREREDVDRDVDGHLDRQRQTDRWTDCNREKASATYKRVNCRIRALWRCGARSLTGLPGPVYPPRLISPHPRPPVCRVVN